MDFKMRIETDPDTNEYFLVFADRDDRVKKSRYLKAITKGGSKYVTMSINEENQLYTESQWGMYKAFQILIKEYSGCEIAEVKQTIHSSLNVTEEEIKSYTVQEFSEFIERIFKMCAEEMGLFVDCIDGRLKIIQS